MLLFIDVKKAHLNGKCDNDATFIELPPEVAVPGKCGQLRRWLYGMRGAARDWEDNFVEKLAESGYVRGRSAPTVFSRKVQMPDALSTEMISLSVVPELN